MTSATPNEWLTAAELGRKLGYASRTVRKKMHDGTWRKGEHWFKRAGCRPLFWWPAIVEWIKAESSPPAHAEGAAYGQDIPRGGRRLTKLRNERISASDGSQAADRPSPGVPGPQGADRAS